MASMKIGGDRMADYIKREDAMKTLADEYDECEFKRYAEGLFKDIPSADVVPVVRCKDCRWWDNSEDSPYGYCMAMKHGYMSENWEIGIYRTYKGDFYCADGERKDDESERD